MHDHRDRAGTLPTRWSRATRPVPPIRRFAAVLCGVIVLSGGCAQGSTRGGEPTETPTMGIRPLPITGSLTIEGGPLEGHHEVLPGVGQDELLPGGCSTTDHGHGRELQILGHVSVEDSLVHFMFFAPYGSGEDLRARRFTVWGGDGEFEGEARLTIDIGPELPRGGRGHLSIHLDGRAGSMRISGDLDCIDDGRYPDPTPGGRRTDRGDFAGT